MKHKRFIPFLILGITVLLAACSYRLHPTAFIPKDIPSQTAAHRINKINMTTSDDGDIGLLFDKDNFRIAIEQSLKKAGLFKSDEPNGYKLEAHVLRANSPAIALEMTVTMDVRYRLSDPSGRILFTEEIRTEGKASLSEAFTGAQRWYYAMDRVRQTHSNLLIGRLGAVLVQ